MHGHMHAQVVGEFDFQHHHVHYSVSVDASWCCCPPRRQHRTSSSVRQWWNSLASYACAHSFGKAMLDTSVHLGSRSMVSNDLVRQHQTEYWRKISRKPSFESLSVQLLGCSGGHLHHDFCISWVPEIALLFCLQGHCCRHFSGLLWSCCQGFYDCAGYTPGVAQARL